MCIIIKIQFLEPNTTKNEHKSYLKKYLLINIKKLYFKVLKIPLKSRTVLHFLLKK